MADKPNLYCMVGLSASGKSTIAKEIAEKEDCVIVSSDAIRGEICEGGVSDQSKNEEVFKIFYRRIKDNLKACKNVIADATNITMKSRRSLLENIKGISCYKIAYIVPKPVEQCIEDNVDREHPVPREVIEGQMRKFQIPFVEEGFDEIIMYNFENAHVNGAFVFDCYKKMMGFDQKNPHHTMDLYGHSMFVYEKFRIMKDYLWTEYVFGAELHDVGKLFTKTFDENGIAHYYGHESVGCYYLLSNLENIRIHRDYSDEELLNILFLVNYHMMPMTWDSDKTNEKWLRRFGKYKYELLLDFAECDNSKD